MIRKMLGILGLFFAGFCLLYGPTLCWMTALPLLMPQVFAKSQLDLGLGLMMFAAGLALTATGWFTLQKSEQIYSGKRAVPRQRAQRW